jgi:hypothetical protein
MPVRTVLLSVFIVSMLIAVFGMAANIYVLFALRRRRVRFQSAWAGMPTHALRLCRELPPSPERNRLVRLAKSAVIAFLVAMIGAGISGPMLGSLDDPCDAKPNGYQDNCPKASGRDASQAAPDYSKLYDPSSLQEVMDFNTFPTGIKSHFGVVWKTFTVGGLNATSALVGYQEGDYVPSYAAEAYVYTNTKWIKVKTWNGLGQAKNLSELIEVIRYAENSTPPKGLNYTLSSLNLADPISDLNKNIAAGKIYFVGLCELPGHTPGVEEADERLVHTPAHGLWCLAFGLVYRPPSPKPPEFNASRQPR